MTTETILVADDEPVVLMLTEKLLKQAGYRVLTATDGQQALAVYRQHADEIALVVTDLRMPKLDGLELLRHLKQLNRHLKVLVVTGSVVADMVAENLAAGPDEMLAKPYHIADLVKTVKRMLCREGR